MRHTLTVLVLALLAGLIQLFAAPSAGACPQTVVIGVDGTGSVGHTHVIPAGPMTPLIPPVEQRQIPFAPDLRDVIDYQVPVLPDVPPLPNLTEPYVERPLSVYVPDHVEPYVPAPILDHVPPPLPQLPPLPVIELPPLPALPQLPALPAL